MSEYTCPQCEDEGRGAQRLGHSRAVCALCNRHAQRVRRAVSASLQARHSEDAERLRAEHEQRLYEQALREYKYTGVYEQQEAR